MVQKGPAIEAVGVKRLCYSCNDMDSTVEWGYFENSKILLTVLPAGLPNAAEFHTAFQNRWRRWRRRRALARVEILRGGGGGVRGNLEQRISGRGATEQHIASVWSPFHSLQSFPSHADLSGMSLGRCG